MMTERRHFTTRRAFVAAAGFGGVSLYGSWAAYGAAPGPLALFAAAGPEHGPDPVADPGAAHGASPTEDLLTPDEFRERLRDFIDRFELPDGSVQPRGTRAEAVRVAEPHADGRQEAAPGPETSAGSPGAQAAGPRDLATGDHATPGQPVDVWLLAAQFAFDPAHLRLETGQPYRFRMMAAETAHGASIQFGRGGRMIRLRPGRVAEAGMTFDRPGTYLVSCTVYCGVGHDVMQARITVADAEGAAA